MRPGSISLFGVVLLGCGLLFDLSSVEAVRAAEPDDSTDADVRRVADMIDELVADAWKKNNVTPAPLSSDSEFLRRVYLDVTGKIPSLADAMDFLESATPNKRREVVDRLLEGPGYITHFTTYWRNVMIPEVKADFQVRSLVPSFDAWLRRKLTDNTQYDQLVKEILTTSLESARNRRNQNERLGETSPLAFYQAKQIAPENLAAGTSRIFLGIRIECAQCHDHPFDSWNREQFWSFAAFFGGIERTGNRGIFGTIRELFDRRELNVPGTDTVVQASYLDGTEPQWRFRVGPRQTLAEWITSPKNPYFARTAANRLWGYFFGRGIVDPVDDFTATNPPSHPKLLDYLAKEFAAHNFDLKFLIRAITASRTYQLTSLKTHSSQTEPRLFSRMAVRGLTSEQIFDSVAQAISELHFVLAATARDRATAKPVLTPVEASMRLRGAAAAGQSGGILFGGERSGLSNDEVALADAVITIPTDPGFPSLNLGQAVLLTLYEWFKAGDATPPFRIDHGAGLPATRAELFRLFAHLEDELDRGGFLYPPGNRTGMVRNLRAILHRAQLTDQEVRTLRGVIVALTKGKKRGVSEGQD